MTQDTPQRDCPGSAKAPGEILELFKGGYLSIAETIDALEPAFLGAAQGAADPVQDTYLVGGPSDLKAMSGSVESDRIIQLHFRRAATDADRQWLLGAINAKLLSDAVPQPASYAYGEAGRGALIDLIGSAYNAGFNEGMREHSTSRGGLPWSTQNKKYSALLDKALAVPSPQSTTTTRNLVDSLCADCPPVGYETDKTRCLVCPRRGSELASTQSEGE